MGATYKLSDGFSFEDFELIAIHATVPEHKLAYHLNRVGGLRLARSHQDLVLNEETWFPVYEWIDEINDDQWALIGNRCTTANAENTGLFKATSSMILNYLIEERKEVNYFLKLTTEHPERALQMVKKIKALPHIVTSYTIDIDTLRSHTNLIF